MKYLIRLIAVIALCMTVSCSASSNKDADGPEPDPQSDAGQADMQVDMQDEEVDPVAIRVATYNTSLFRDESGGLIADLSGGENQQATRVARVIQRLNPDIVFLNEFDYDAQGEALETFRTQYVGQGDGAVDYPHAMAFESNTGVPSGFDLDNNGAIVSEPGSVEYGNDSFGFGQFEGQYAFAVLSKFPLGEVREFRTLLWSADPGALIPRDFYSEEEVAGLRLSSKNHVDLEIDVEGRTLHLLGSHPTPPAFDGPEDRNGKRNHDEVQFWADYLNGEEWIVDDSGSPGGLAEGSHFVIVGDLNLDPNDGDSLSSGILEVLEHPRTIAVEPRSEGAVEAAESQGQANDRHQGDPALDTADFSDGRVGNLRVDYAIPSATMRVVDTGVFWPTSDAEGADLVDASDHRAVWVDLEIP